MLQFVCILMFYIITVNTQGLFPDCPVCPPCGSVNTERSQPNTEDIISLPSEILTLKEGIQYIKTRVRDQPLKYIARQTLKEVDRIIDTTVDATPKLSVFLEAVASHILDAVLPGGSKLIDVVKFVLGMVRSSNSARTIYKQELDPALQSQLVDSIANMLAMYELENPGCIKSSTPGSDGLYSFHNFIYHESICPTQYDNVIMANEGVELVDIRIRAPVDFSRYDTNDLLLRGVVSITFNDVYTMRLLPQYLQQFDNNGLSKLMLLHKHAIGNTTLHSITTYFNHDDLGTLVGDQFSLCMQQQLFAQLRLHQVNVFTTALIPYTPQTFSSSQMGVKRLVCSAVNSQNSCASLICQSSRRFVEFVTKLNGITIPADFDTSFKRNKRYSRKAHRHQKRIRRHYTNLNHCKGSSSYCFS